VEGKKSASSCYVRVVVARVCTCQSTLMRGTLTCAMLRAMPIHFELQLQVHVGACNPGALGVNGVKATTLGCHEAGFQVFFWC